MKQEERVRFIPIGGVGTVTKNMYLYEYEGPRAPQGREILIVDCGIGFPDSDIHGVDVVLPDISYLQDKLSQIAGLVVTHGHEDHFGAIPYLAQNLGNPPVYATKLVIGFLQAKFKDFKQAKLPRFVELNPEGDGIAIGGFKLDTFRVNHSVPDGVGLVITTPLGKFFHVADYKFDWTPVDGKFFDIQKASHLAEGEVMALASDSLGSNTDGYTRSEREIEAALERVIERTQKQVFVTTVSSNILRIQQAINASLRHNRQVSFIGRSIEQNIEVAKQLGYVTVPKGAIIPLEQAKHVPQDRITYIVAGSYGQENSALWRLANDEHKQVKVLKDSAVIFSADPSPPGVKDNVDLVIDRLTERGADVHYYEIQENLYVSGHGARQDIQMLMGIVQPKYFIPIGGSVRHNRSYALLARQMGASPDAVFELNNGDTINFGADHKGVLGNKVPVKDVFIDGSSLGVVQDIVLRDRQDLAEDGIFVIAIPLNKQTGRLQGKVEIISRGFIYMKASEELLRSVEKRVQQMVQEAQGNTSNYAEVKNNVAKRIEKYLMQKTGRSPMVIPLILEI